MPITANSFTLKNADPQKIAQLDIALQYLQSNSPNMAAPMLEQAAENQVRIVFADPVVNRTDGYGEGSHEIVWDPSSGLVVFENGKAIGVESAANGLFHEIAHSLEINQVSQHDGLGSDNGQYGNNSEATATIYANAVANDCGEPQRSDYKSGKPIEVSNPTAHTTQGASGTATWSQDSGGQVQNGPQFQPGSPAPDFGSNGGGGGAWEGDGTGFDPNGYGGGGSGAGGGGAGGGGGPAGDDGGVGDGDGGQEHADLTAGNGHGAGVHWGQSAVSAHGQYLTIPGNQHSDQGAPTTTYGDYHSAVMPDHEAAIIVGTAHPVIEHFMLF